MDKKENHPEIIRIRDKGIKESTRAFGERIRTFRREAGYSQKDIAEKMNVSRNTVINWEAGKSYTYTFSISTDDLVVNITNFTEQW